MFLVEKIASSFLDPMSKQARYVCCCKRVLVDILNRNYVVYLTAQIATEKLQQTVTINDQSLLQMTRSMLKLKT